MGYSPTPHSLLNRYSDAPPLASDEKQLLLHTEALQRSLLLADYIADEDQLDMKVSRILSKANVQVCDSPGYDFTPSCSACAIAFAVCSRARRRC